MKTSFIKKITFWFLITVLATLGQTWTSGETTVTLKDGTLTVSGNGAMADYDGTRNWGESPPWWEKNSSIKSVIIEDGVTSIGKWVFTGCSLTSVVIGNSVSVIGFKAFSHCKNLTSVTLPNSVTIIGAGAGGAFEATGLTSVTIPSSVIDIWEGEFLECTALTSINVAANNANYSSEDGVLFDKKKTTLIIYPRGKYGAYTISPNVTNLGKFAFHSCLGLTSLTSLNPIPPSIVHDKFDYETFLFVPSCLYVPKNSIDAYRAAVGWKDFKCVKDLASAPK